MLTSRKERSFVWECIVALRQKIIELLLKLRNEILPHYLEIQLLMLLSIPNIRFRQSNTIVEIVPFPSTDKIWVVGCYDPNSREMKLTLQSVDNATHKHFYWQQWINIAMGCLSGYDEAQRNLGMSVPNERSVTNVDLRLEVMTVKPSFTKDAEISETLHYWVGWPVFDTKLCHFEFDEWFRIIRGKYAEKKHIDEQVEMIEREISSIKKWKCF